MQLTEFGQKIAAWLDAKDWAAQLAPDLVDEATGKQPFQIDEINDRYVQTQLSESLKERVAACAYEFGIDRDSVLSVLRVALRNELIRIIEKAPTH